MHFERYTLYAVIRREFNRFLPVRNKHLVPLIIELVEVFVRPRAGNPARVFRVGVGSRATRESYDTVDSDLSGENTSRFEIFLERLRDFLVRVNAVAVYRNRRNSDVVLAERIHKFFAGGFVLDENFRVRVNGPRVSAHSEFELRNAKFVKFLQAVFEAHAAEYAVYDA